MAAQRNRALLGISDQVLSSLTSFGTSFVAARLLGAGRFGTVAAALSVGVVALGFQRALVGDTLLAYASMREPGEQRRMGRDASVTALVIGLATGLVCIGVGLLPFTLTREVGWMGVWLPAILVQDAVRYRFYCSGRILGALVSDLVWVLAETVLLVGVWVGPGFSGPWILAAWGGGALVAAVVGLAMVRSLPWQGNPLRWLRESIHLSGWFTAQVTVGQAQTQGIVFVVGGLISAAALGGLKSMQLVLVQPVQSLMLAAQSLLVPRFARAYAARDRDRVVGMARQLTLGFAALAVVGAAIVILLRRPIVEVFFGRDYLPFTSLMLPVAVSSLFYATRTPYTAGCRGLQNARGTFTIQVIYTAVTLPAIVLGAVVWGVQGAAWGIAVGSLALHLAAWQVFRWTVRRRLSADAPAAREPADREVLPGTDVDPVSGSTLS